METLFLVFLQVLKRVPKENTNQSLVLMPDASLSACPYVPRSVLWTMGPSPELAPFGRGSRGLPKSFGIQDKMPPDRRAAHTIDKATRASGNVEVSAPSTT